jgi:hypothetical protein
MLNFEQASLIQLLKNLSRSKLDSLLNILIFKHSKPF